MIDSSNLAPFTGFTENIETMDALQARIQKLNGIIFASI